MTDTFNPSPFKAFDRRREVRVYRRSLPHWRQDGATYFVTFRLADSIPVAVAAGWREERRIWFEAHGLHRDLGADAWAARYLEVDERSRRAFERRQSRCLFAELSKCHGECLLRQTSLAAVLRDALLHMDGSRLQCGDFVIMPNHAHAVIMPLPGWELEELLKSIKGFSSRQINLPLGRRGRLWQKENFDHIVRDRRQLHRVRAYIQRNLESLPSPDAELLYYRAGWLDE